MFDTKYGRLINHFYFLYWHLRISVSIRHVCICIGVLQCFLISCYSGRTFLFLIVSFQLLQINYFILHTGEMDRIQETDQSNKTRYSSSSAVALAIKGSKKSKYVVQWALNKFVPEGMIIFKLIHVHAGIIGVPTPCNMIVYFVLQMNNFV